MKRANLTAIHPIEVLYKTDKYVISRIAKNLEGTDQQDCDIPHHCTTGTGETTCFFTSQQKELYLRSKKMDLYGEDALLLVNKRMKALKRFRKDLEYYVSEVEEKNQDGVCSCSEYVKFSVNLDDSLYSWNDFHKYVYQIVNAPDFELEKITQAKFCFYALTESSTPFPWYLQFVRFYNCTVEDQKYSKYRVISTQQVLNNSEYIEADFFIEKTAHLYYLDPIYFIRNLMCSIIKNHPIPIISTFRLYKAYKKIYYTLVCTEKKTQTRCCSHSEAWYYSQEGKKVNEDQIERLGGRINIFSRDARKDVVFRGRLGYMPFDIQYYILQMMSDVINFGTFMIFHPKIARSGLFTLLAPLKILDQYDRRGIYHFITGRDYPSYRCYKEATDFDQNENPCSNNNKKIEDTKFIGLGTPKKSSTTEFDSLFLRTDCHAFDVSKFITKHTKNKVTTFPKHLRMNAKFWDNIEENTENSEDTLSTTEEFDDDDDDKDEKARVCFDKERSQYMMGLIKTRQNINLTDIGVDLIYNTDNDEKHIVI